MTAPAPLTPPDCDLRAFRDMPFDVGRFRDSGLVTHEEPEAIVAAILLWGVAWHQVPAASLPNDDKLLAKYAGYGRAIESWDKVKAGALRGFVLCSDGRLYQTTLAEKANASWDSRLKYEHTKAADRHRKAEKDLPKEEKTEFPSFDDWKHDRPAPPPTAHRQGNLPLEAAGIPTEQSSERAHAGAHGSRTERARTGASPVPTANSDGNDQQFQRNDPTIPLENTLKGREGKGRESSIDSPPTSVSVDRPGRLASADLKVLYDAVCEASGFTSSSPEAINRAYQQIERWRDNGFDFDNVVIPTILHTVANSEEPTRGLARFTKAISHEHARTKARTQLGKAPDPPKAPILQPQGEDPLFRPIRLALLEAMGPQTYSWNLNHVTLEDPGTVAGKRPLKLNSPLPHVLEALRSGNHGATLKRIARANGFDDVW